MELKLGNIMGKKNKDVVRHMGRGVDPQLEGLKRGIDGIGRNLDVLKEEIIRMQENVKVKN